MIRRPGELPPVLTHTHWASTMVGSGGRLVTNAGCIPDARLGVSTTTGQSRMTSKPEDVTCPVCQALPSYRAAMATVPRHLQVIR